jgi:hypothetical protein
MRIHLEHSKATIDLLFGLHVQGVFKKCPCKAAGTRFEARNCVGDPGPQGLYRDTVAMAMNVTFGGFRWGESQFEFPCSVTCTVKILTKILPRNNSSDRRGIIIVAENVDSRPNQSLFFLEPRL